MPRVDDPAADGWQSESLAQVVGSELKKLAMILEHPAELGPERLAALVAHEFVAGPLRPQRLRRVFADDALRVLRQAEDSAEEPRATSRVSRGPEGFAISLAGLLAPLRQASDIHAKFEVVGVDPSGDRVATRQILSLSGHTPSGTVEIHSAWESAWQIRGDGTIRLTSLTASDYEETTLEAAGEGTLFSDCTEAVLAGNSSFEQQILQGPSYWLGRLEAALGTDIMGHSGLAVGDVNGDGLDDLYVPQHGGLPNRLYVQTRDGTATDRSAWAGVDWLDRSLGTLLVDLDNDGDQDLVVGTSPALLLMANDGRGRFSLRATRREARYAYSLAAADYDNDGDLDIYATRYSPIRDDPVEESVNVPKPIPYYDAENGAPNVLLRNDGDWRFTDATLESGLDADNRRWSFAASWEDYDLDGDQDLYVANDFGRNCLYRNQGGHFVNVAAEAGVEDVASGMSVSWGDANRDGLPDIYVGNMFSSAGHRITGQPNFKPTARQSTRSMIRRMARGNSLFLARRDGSFHDTSLEAAVTLGRWAWSSLFADLNNDGWEDLVVANGFLTADDPDDL